MAGADPEAVGMIENGEARVYRLPVEQRLPHPHEHHVGRPVGRIEQQHLPDLPGDLPGREVPPEAHASGGAEAAAQGATGLR